MGTRPHRRPGNAISSERINQAGENSLVPRIDRDLQPDRPGKEVEHSSKAIVFTMILVAVLVLGAIAGLIVQIAESGGSHSSETPVRTPAGVFYFLRAPISIVGNGNFTITNGVSGGNGTASNPYIIANWAINASSKDGISIQGTDAYFKVRNCYVHDGRHAMTGFRGITLSNCVNGTLENNNCTKNDFGIVLDSSSHSNALINNSCSFSHYDGIDILHSSDDGVLINNTCISNSGAGIGVGSSSYNLIVNNSCVSNSEWGIAVGSSNYNTIVNNTCTFSSSNGNGIDVELSSHITVIDNNCSSNSHFGVFLYQSSNITVINNTCNSNTNDGIMLSSSNHNELRNNNCSNGNIGIYLLASSHNTLSENNCSLNSHEGMYLYSSSNSNELSRNHLSGNAMYAVIILNAATNRFWNDTFIDNNGATSTFNSSHVQARDDGTNNWWNSTEGYGNWWSDWQSPDNVQPHGIVDLPYNISGSAGAKDNYPLTTTQTPIPEFGMMPFVVMALMAVIVLAGHGRRKNRL